MILRDVTAYGMRTTSTMAVHLARCGVLIIPFSKGQAQPIGRNAVLLLGRDVKFADRSLHGFLCTLCFKFTQLRCTGAGNPRHAPARGSLYLFCHAPKIGTGDVESESQSGAPVFLLTLFVDRV